MAHLTVELIILHNTDDARVHPYMYMYLGTNPKKIDSLLAQVICPKYMAVMGNPWCLQDCQYLNNLACALGILFGFLDRSGKRSWVLIGHLEDEDMRSGT